jgi:hypothetical protein
MSEPVAECGPQSVVGDLVLGGLVDIVGRDGERKHSKRGTDNFLATILESFHGFYILHSVELRIQPIN